MNDKTDKNQNISRRDALKKMGALTATAAISMSGVEALASTVGSSGEAKKSLKVLLINGSARRKGNTFTLLSEIAGQLNKNSIDSEIVNIGSLPVHGCIACGRCHAEHLGKCVFDDDVCNKLLDKMAECDGIIVGSPVYYGQPAGQVLAVLQRMRSKTARQASRRRNGMPPRRSNCRFPDSANAFPDAQHAYRYFAILEHRLRNSRGRGFTRRRGLADHAHACRQHGLHAQAVCLRLS